VVEKPPELSDRTLPVVKVIKGPDDEEVTPFLADLNDLDPETNGPRRTIVETISASKHFEDITEFAELL
jgi:hypothetical protein